MDIAHADGREGGLTPACARTLRNDLRASLTAYASGRGSIEGVLHEIERVVKYVSGDADMPLGREKAQRRMRRFVNQHASGRLNDTGLPGVAWNELYRGVVRARNDIAHTGTEAALAGTRTTALATVLMEALGKVAMQDGTRKMKDVMVSNPTCAQRWQTLADVRRTMLVNDYTVLPLSDGNFRDESWKSVQAEHLARYLEAGALSRRGETLDSAMKNPSAASLFSFVRAFSQEESVDKIWSGSPCQELPVVITRRPLAHSERTEIVGIVTAFDLL